MQTFKTPTRTVLYSIEEAIKEYRKLSNRNIVKVIPDITVDQVLILILLKNNNNLSQMEIGDLVFKDYASITRIINLMIKKEYLIKSPHKVDKRRSAIKITTKGMKAIENLEPVIKLNRETALKNISNKEMNQLFSILNKITNNCKHSDS